MYATAKWIRRALRAVILLTTVVITCQSSSLLFAEVWNAKWIAAPTGPQRDNAVYHFQKTLDLTSVPKNLLVHVSADNRFALYVNGHRAGEGPALSDLQHWNYERIDLAPYLHEGHNVIAATVWNFGVAAEVAQMTARTGFLMQAEDETWKSVNTDATWKVELERGHAAQTVDYIKLLKAYYAAAPGEKIDGSQYDWQWMEDASGRSSGEKGWEDAMVIGPPRSNGQSLAATPWILQPDPLPPMEHRPISIGRVVSINNAERLRPQDMTFTIKPQSHATILLDAGTMTTGYPEVTLSGGAHAQIRMTYAEFLLDENGHKGNRNEVAGRHITGMYDDLIADGGSGHVFSPLDWRAWRYLQMDIVTGSEPLQIDGITATFSAFPFQTRARFVSDDADLNKIWEVGWYTTRLCSHETYMDTPYWERLQYVGDYHSEALVSYAVAGDDRLARQAINALDNSRLTDGIMQSRYPSAFPQLIPAFSLLWVDVLHEFWMYRDDPQYVKSHLPASRSVLDWFLQYQRDDGMIGQIPWWSWVDWTKEFPGGEAPHDKDGDSALITLQVLEALRNAADLERQLGDGALAVRYDQAADRASAAIWKNYWNPAAGLLADTKSQDSFSQQTNSLAVLLNVVPKRLQKEVMQRVLSTKEVTTGPAAKPIPVAQSSYYFAFYISRALESSGLSSLYVSSLGPWRQMLADGLTSWEERHELRPRSDSHAYGAHPTYDLLRLVAGIKPGSPGFSTIVIEPHLGTLRSLNAAMPSPKGQIEVSFKTTERGTHATLTIPDQTPAKLIWYEKTYPLHAGKQDLELP